MGDNSNVHERFQTHLLYNMTEHVCGSNGSQSLEVRSVVLLTSDAVARLPKFDLLNYTMYFLCSGFNSYICCSETRW